MLSFVRHVVCRLRRDSGSMLLETVIAIGICTPVLFLMFDMCRLMYACSVAIYAGESGLHYASVHGIDAGANACSGPGCIDANGQNIVQVVNRGLKMGVVGSGTDAKTVTSVVWKNTAGTGTASSPTPGSTVLLTMKVPFNSYLLPTSLTTFHFQFRGQVEY